MVYLLDTSLIFSQNLLVYVVTPIATSTHNLVMEASRLGSAGSVPVRELSSKSLHALHATRELIATYTNLEIHRMIYVLLSTQQRPQHLPSAELDHRSEGLANLFPASSGPV